MKSLERGYEINFEGSSPYKWPRLVCNTTRASSVHGEGARPLQLIESKC